MKLSARGRKGKAHQPVKEQKEESVQIKKEERTDEAGEEHMDQYHIPHDSLKAHQPAEQQKEKSVQIKKEERTDEAGEELMDQYHIPHDSLILSSDPNPSCARCIILNSAAATKQRQCRVLELFLNQRSDIKDPMVPEIVVPRKDRTRSLQKYLLKLEKSGKLTKVVQDAANKEDLDNEPVVQSVINRGDMDTELVVKDVANSGDMQTRLVAQSVASKGDMDTSSVKPMTTKCSHVPQNHLVSPRTRRKRNFSPEPAQKKSCVVDLRSIKKPSTESDNNPFIRTGKINLSKLKSSQNQESLRQIVKQKNLSVKVMKLSSADLPSKCHRPTLTACKSATTNEQGFTFNLDQVVSKAAEQFSFSVAPTTETADKSLQAPRKETVFERLGEQVNPFIAELPMHRPSTPPIDIHIPPPIEDPMSPVVVGKPRTPDGPAPSEIQEEDILEIHPMEDFIDEVTTDVLVPNVVKKSTPNPPAKTSTMKPTTGQRSVRIMPPQRAAFPAQHTTIPAQHTTISKQTAAARPSTSVPKQHIVPVRDSKPSHQQWTAAMPPPSRQFDKPAPQPYKQEQVSQWVHNTWSNPPPPPPGYLTPSEGSGAVIFSFPSNSSPVPTPATTPPHGLEDDFDSISVHQNGNNNDRKPAPSLPWPLPQKRDLHTPNGFVPYNEPPKGLCFKYWKTGSCSQKRNCKFLHVRNPEVSMVCVVHVLCVVYLFFVTALCVGGAFVRLYGK